MKHRKTFFAVMAVIVIAVIYFSSGKILITVGEFLVIDEDPEHSDAVIVLNTGMEYYPRLIEAAKLYNQGYVKKIVINGNRKSDTLRELEMKGFQVCCPWYEERFRILDLFDIPRKAILAISVEDAYDTISEAQAVGKELVKKRISSIIIVTSKSHTRRARHIWESIWKDQFDILMVSARRDPYSSHSWWKSGRQIRWVLSEYGGWIYYFWKSISEAS